MSSDENGKIEVFLKDYIIEMPIGVFDHEKGRSQRVKWSVTAYLTKTDSPSTDSIDSTFSYDDIVASIQRVAQSGHIHLLETAAGYVADECLTHSRVESIKTTLEKLDIYDGQGIPGITLFKVQKNAPQV